MAVSENKRVFSFKAIMEWKPIFENMFKDNLKSKAESSDQPSDLFIDKDKIDEFRRQYSHIRAYHACRPEDVSSYYDKGLLLRNKDDQIERFRSLFLGGKFPELTEEMLQQSIEKLVPYSDADGELCLALDDRFIIAHCGQYLISGSEYLAALVIQLPIDDSKEYLSVLRGIGKPIFFEIDLPNTPEYVSDSDICNVIDDMIEQWQYCLANSTLDCSYSPCTIPIYKPLESKHICSHYHPKKIPDPNMGWKVYDAETGKYVD